RFRGRFVHPYNVVLTYNVSPEPVEPVRGGAMRRLEDLDFFTDRALVEDPYPYYDALRACPVRREPKHGVVMVSGYDEVAAVLRDERESYSLCNVVSGPFPGLPVEAEGDDISELIEQYRDSLPLSDYFASFDPPKHTAHRSLLGRLFTPKRLAE